MSSSHFLRLQLRMKLDWEGLEVHASAPGQGLQDRAADTHNEYGQTCTLHPSCHPSQGHGRLECCQHQIAHVWTVNNISIQDISHSNITINIIIGSVYHLVVP